MNIVDSSGWLEYFSDGANASQFENALKDIEALVVPSVSIYEVFKVLLRERGESAAFKGTSAMQAALVVDLTSNLALTAASLSLAHSLPMADSIILATARAYDAILWTQDIDFKDIPGVRYFPKSGGVESIP